MYPAIVIAGKDLKQRVRDRSAIMLSVVAPLGLALILSQLVPTDGETEVHRYAVVDLDGGSLAAAFSEGPLRGLDRSDFGEIFDVSSSADARGMAREGQIAAAFILPAGFSAGVTSGGGGTIDIVGNPESPIATAVAQSVASSYAQELNAAGLAATTAVTLEGGNPGSGEIERLSGQASSLPAPVVVGDDPAASREFDSNTFFAAGMAMFFLFFMAQFGVLSLLTERREGTLARLVAAPISTSSIVVAKALSTLVFGVVSMSVLVVASALLMGAEWGDPVGVALLILGGVIAAMGLTSLIGGFARTDQQAAGITTIVAVTLGMLGGTFFPVSQAPGLLQALTRVTPHFWLMRGFGDLSGGGASAADIVTPVAALLLFGIATGGVALLRARRMVMEA